MVGHVADEQSLARRVGSLAHPGFSPLATGCAALVVLHRQSPTLEYFLVKGVEGLVGLLLSGKLDVCKTLAQTPVVGDDSAVRDLAVLGELGLKLRGGDLEEQVADVKNFGGRGRGGRIVGSERVIGSDGVASLATDGRCSSLCTLGHLRGGFLDLVRRRANLADCLRGLCGSIGSGLLDLLSSIGSSFLGLLNSIRSSLLSLLGKIGGLLGDGLGLVLTLA